MSDDEKKQQSEASQEPLNSDDGKKPDTNEPPESIPYGRFKEVNEERQQLKSRLEKLEQERETQRKKELEEKEEFKSLYEQEQEKREAAEKEAQRWQDYKDQKRETLMEDLSEEDQDIASGLSLEKLEKFVKRQQVDKQETNQSSSMLLRKHGFQTPREAADAHNRGEISYDQYKEISREFRERLG